MEDIINIPFFIPSWVKQGLQSGQLERKGGIIRDKETKTVKLWLRETSLLPQPNIYSVQYLPPSDRKLLGMTNSERSVISLGVNQIASRLDGIEDALLTLSERLEIIEQLVRSLYQEVRQVKDIIVQGFNMVFDRLQNLQWAIDVGFLNMQAGLEYYNQKQLENFEKFHEMEFIARLKHAAKLAMDAQYLEPKSQTRMVRMENAINETGKASALLWEYTNSKLIESINKLSQKHSNDFSIDKSILNSLYLLRQSCFASNLEASLLSETSLPAAKDANC